MLLEWDQGKNKSDQCSGWQRQPWAGYLEAGPSSMSSWYLILQIWLGKDACSGLEGTQWHMRLLRSPGREGAKEEVNISWGATESQSPVLCTAGPWAHLIPTESYEVVAIFIFHVRKLKSWGIAQCVSLKAHLKTLNFNFPVVIGCSCMGMTLL